MYVRSIAKVNRHVPTILHHWKPTVGVMRSTHPSNTEYEHLIQLSFVRHDENRRLQRTFCGHDIIAVLRYGTCMHEHVRLIQAIAFQSQVCDDTKWPLHEQGYPGWRARLWMTCPRFKKNSGILLILWIIIYLCMRQVSFLVRVRVQKYLLLGRASQRCSRWYRVP